MKLKNIVKHFLLITKHKWVVLKLCIKVGIPWRGLLHDLSKYSPTEFWESARYFNGKYSPITDCKNEKGYSKAWLHHKGRNRHHPEYWFDHTAPDKTPLIPYPYVAEMICDKMAAGMIYNGNNFTKDTELIYWQKESQHTHLNPKIKEMLTDIFTQVSQNGVKKTITKNNLKKAYRKHCGEIK